jgi:hypothetical protein
MVSVNDILYVPKLNVNLKSITKCLEHHGVSFSGFAEGTSLNFGTKKYKLTKNLHMVMVNYMLLTLFLHQIRNP